MGPQAQDQREQQRRGRGARSDLPTRLAWIIGLVGLLVAAFTGLSGDAPLILSIAAGSCLVAGLLLSVGREGRDGAIEVLKFPLVVAGIFVVAVLGGASSSVSDGLSLLVFGAAPIVLFVAACTEVGCVGGRLLAGRIRA